MIPLTFRNDGFTTYFREPPLTPEMLRSEYIDPLANTNVGWVGWGVGPSSVFCYGTRIGDVFGDDLTEEQWTLFRQADSWVHQNLRSLIDSGNDPLDTAVARAHEHGLKIYARYQMNHEYGPPGPENHLWLGFVGRFNKEHPEYRIHPGTNLDFVHPAVRQFKLDIIREIATRGVDAVMVDFTVYPPHMAEPDPPVITGFMRDVRRVVQEVATERGRAIQVIAELPYRGSLELGLDWRAWMREGLIDIIVPTRLKAGEVFDVRIEEFVELGRRHGCKVWGFIWFSLGLLTTDQAPADDKTGARRYSKPKTTEMYHAQALHFHRAGVDGIELVGASGLEWAERRWYDQLADREFLEQADKHYMVDPGLHVPVRFTAGKASVPIRVADDVQAALAAGRQVTATVVVYCRGLRQGESLGVGLNGEGPAVVHGGNKDEATDAPIDWRTQQPAWTDGAAGTFLADPHWWRRGEHYISVDAAWILPGDNRIDLRFSGDDFETSWIDLLINYGPADTGA
jgi:hypothetical protein